jgi:hypothetical protein
LKIKPYRALKDDIELTATATSYAGTGSAVSLAKPQAASARKPPPTRTGSLSGTQRRPVRVTESLSAPVPKPRPAPEAPRVVAPAILPTADGLPKKSDGSPDFAKMTPAQKVTYARRRIHNDMARNGNGNGQS